MNPTTERLLTEKLKGELKRRFEELVIEEGISPLHVEWVMKTALMEATEAVEENCANGKWCDPHSSTPCKKDCCWGWNQEWEIA